MLCTLQPTVTACQAGQSPAGSKLAEKQAQHRRLLKVRWLHALGPHIQTESSLTVHPQVLCSHVIPCGGPTDLAQYGTARSRAPSARRPGLHGQTTHRPHSSIWADSGRPALTYGGSEAAGEQHQHGRLRPPAGQRVLGPDHAPAGKAAKGEVRDRVSHLQPCTCRAVIRTRTPKRVPRPAWCLTRHGGRGSDCLACLASVYLPSGVQHSRGMLGMLARCMQPCLLCPVCRIIKPGASLAYLGESPGNYCLLDRTNISPGQRADATVEPRCPETGAMASAAGPVGGVPDTPGPRAATTPTASKPAGKGSRLVASLVPKYRPEVKLTSDAFTPAPSSGQHVHGALQHPWCILAAP